MNTDLSFQLYTVNIFDFQVVTSSHFSLGIRRVGSQWLPTEYSAHTSFVSMERDSKANISYTHMQSSRNFKIGDQLSGTHVNIFLLETNCHQHFNVILEHSFPVFGSTSVRWLCLQLVGTSGHS